MTLRRCSNCKLEKILEEFSIHNKKTGGRKSWCKDCTRAYDRRRGKVRHAAGYKAPRIRENLDKINILKSETPCADCGNTFHPICMDFDHVRGEKRQEVSRLVSDGHTWEILKEEIDKCDIVCANCHRIRSQLTNWGRNNRG